MNNVDLFSCLKYTPYDNKVTSIFSDGINPEEAFFNTLFVPYEEKYSNSIRNKLQDAIDSSKTRFIHFIGSSGTGKTTFLHHYFLNYSKESNYSYDFINLIGRAAIATDDDTIKRNICNRIDEVADGVTITHFIDAYVNSGKKIPILYIENATDDRCLLNYLYRRKHDKNHSAVIALLSKYNPTQLATIFVILSLYKNNNNTGQNIIIFDNIDELTQTYIAENLMTFIISVFSAVQEYFDVIDDKMFGTPSKFVDHCTFIISIRAINAKLLGESQQQNERLREQIKHVNFNPRIYEYSKMLKKRIEYSNTDEDDKRLALRRYCKIVSEEPRYVLNHVEALLNFDRRILTQSFSCIPERTRWFSELNTLPQGVGRRGAILLNTLEFLYSENNYSSLFSAYVRDDKETMYDNKNRCNIHRMCFTLLSNMSGLSLQNKNDSSNLLFSESDFFEQLHDVSLYDFVYRLSQWYEIDEIKNVLKSLISTTSSNYEVPTFLEGNIVEDFTYQFFKSNDFRKSIPTYVEELVNYVMGLADLEKQRIFVKINPLCVVYPYHVFIHFEYYNLLSYYRKGRKSIEDSWIKPLFLIRDKKELRACLDRVYGMFETMVRKMEGHFCGKCKNCQEHNAKKDKNVCNKMLDDFKGQEFCFNGALYSSRTLTSIINYLDSYRVYMWESSSFDKEIQTIVISEIRKYISKFWVNKVQDNSIEEILGTITNTLNNDIEKNGNYSISCMPNRDVFGVE